MNSRINVSYEKVYTDDSGKHTQNIFGNHNPEYFAYKKLWKGVVDGFFECNNTDILLTATEGNMRVVVVVGEFSGKYKFEQYFISGLDGKVLSIPSNVKYAIQNVDECKSSFIIGSWAKNLDIEYSSKGIFNWRKKQP